VPRSRPATGGSSSLACLPLDRLRTVKPGFFPPQRFPRQRNVGFDFKTWVPSSNAISPSARNLCYPGVSSFLRTDSRKPGPPICRSASPLWARTAFRARDGGGPCGAQRAPRQDPECARMPHGPAEAKAVKCLNANTNTGPVDSLLRGALLGIESLRWICPRRFHLLAGIDGL
jgi:hypothetical protein